MAPRPPYPRNEPPEYRKEWAQAFSEALGYFARFGATVAMVVVGLVLVLLAEESADGRFIHSFGLILAGLGLVFAALALRLMHSALMDAILLWRGGAEGLGTRVLRFVGTAVVLLIGAGVVALLFDVDTLVAAFGGPGAG